MPAPSLRLGGPTFLSIFTDGSVISAVDVRYSDNSITTEKFEQAKMSSLIEFALHNSQRFITLF